MKYIADYYNGEDWIVCKPLNKDCERIVEDLVNSARITQNWPEEKKQQYFHRAVSMACDMATRKPKGKLKKLLDKAIHNFFCLTSKLVVYVR